MPLKPPTTLLLGGIGTGKTWSIHTYLKAGLKVAAIFTEPGGEESLINACQETDTPIDNLHYHYVPFASTPWDVFDDQIDRIGRMDYEALSKLKMGPGKGDFKQLVQLFAVLNNFKCQRTDEEFGPVDKFDNTWALVIDSISGLNQMCMDLVVGAKPVAHQGEWGVAMNTEERILNKLTSDLNCFCAVTAHLDKIRDEITGRLMVQPMLLGSKLAPKVPRMFSDVVRAKREDKKFYWTTADGDTELKARNLEISDNLKPSFEPIVAAYRKRLEMVKKKEDEEQTELEHNVRETGLQG